MFNSLNDEIKKSETPASRWLLYGGALAGAIFAMWALYAAVLYLE